MSGGAKKHNRYGKNLISSYGKFVGAMALWFLCLCCPVLIIVSWPRDRALRNRVESKSHLLIHWPTEPSGCDSAHDLQNWSHAQTS